MNVRPQLEELEYRTAPTAADLATFQQQSLPQLQVQFHILVPIVQSTLQSDLNQFEALIPLVPTSFQPLLSAVIVQEQQFVNAFSALANVWFQQTVANFETQLLAQPAVSPPPPTDTGGSPDGITRFSAGSGGDPPTVMGQGMGIGLMSMVGALTLPQGNHS